MTLEVPPRKAVLSADNRCVGSEDRVQARREVGQAVRLDSEEHHVGRANGGKIAGDRGRTSKSLFGTHHSKAPLLHGLQVRASGEQRDVLSSPRQTGADIAADGACTGDDDFHAGSPAYAAATIRR